MENSHRIALGKSSCASAGRSQVCGSKFPALRPCDELTLGASTLGFAVSLVLLVSDSGSRRFEASHRQPGCRAALGWLRLAFRAEIQSAGAKFDAVGWARTAPSYSSRPSVSDRQALRAAGL